MGRLISLKEASQISGYHQDYLSFLIRQNKLNGERIGRAWSVREDELKRFVNTKKEASDIVEKNNQINVGFLINNKIANLVLATFLIILFFSFVVVVKENSEKGNAANVKKLNYNKLQVNTVYSENAKEVFSVASNTNTNH